MSFAAYIGFWCGAISVMALEYFFPVICVIRERRKLEREKGGRS
jgi:hypothetical protein